MFCHQNTETKSMHRKIHPFVYVILKDTCMHLQLNVEFQKFLYCSLFVLILHNVQAIFPMFLLIITSIGILPVKDHFLLLLSAFFQFTLLSLIHLHSNQKMQKKVQKVMCLIVHKYGYCFRFLKQHFFLVLQIFFRKQYYRNIDSEFVFEFSEKID